MNFSKNSVSVIHCFHLIVRNRGLINYCPSVQSLLSLVNSISKTLKGTKI